MDQRVSRRRYTDEEVGEIIRLASRLDAARRPILDDPGLGAEEVRRVAAELGIGREAVEQAIAGHGTQRRRGRRWERLHRLSLFTLQAHAVLFGVSMLGLGAIDLAEGGGFDFLHYPLFGWGILLGWHGALVWLLRRRPR